MKTVLVASAPNKAELEEIINEYFCSASYYIDDNMKLQNRRLNAENVLSKYEIRAKNGRWEFRKFFSELRLPY